MFEVKIVSSDMDNNRSNQLNPNHRAYWLSRGFPGIPTQKERDSYRATLHTTSYGKHDLDNRSNQLNPNNPAYARSRGMFKRYW